MAAGDQGAVQGRGIPLWVWGAGVGAVVLFLYLRRRGGSASAQTPLVGGVATDPNTGYPIDSVSGLPFITSQPTTTTDLSTWAQNAMKALVGAGVSPALASQSIYDYMAGNQLNVQESNAVNQALGLVGFAPQSLPFFGNIPPTPGNVPKLPPAPKISKATLQKLSPSQRKQWMPWTLKSGAKVYIPKGWPTGTPVPTGAPHPVFSTVPTTTVNGSKLVPAA